MFDPENVNIACYIFKELCKYAKGEAKGDLEIQVIQVTLVFLKNLGQPHNLWKIRQ